MRILPPYTSVSIAVISLIFTTGAVSCGRDDIAEVDIVVQHASSTTYALAWIDLVAFHNAQIVPCPNQMMRFANDKIEIPPSLHRPFSAHLADIRDHGVQRIWFCIYSDTPCAAERAVLVCNAPQKLADRLRTYPNLQKADINIFHDAVVIHLRESANVKFDEVSGAKWAGVKSILPALNQSHGYVSRSPFRFFRAEVNDFQQGSRELQKYVYDMTPHIRFFYFQKRFPGQQYGIKVIFDSKEALQSVRARIESMMVASEEGSTGIQITSDGMELSIDATSPAGERRLEIALRTIRSDQGTQLP